MPTMGNQAGEKTMMLDARGITTSTRSGCSTSHSLRLHGPRVTRRHLRLQQGKEPLADSNPIRQPVNFGRSKRWQPRNSRCRRACNPLGLPYTQTFVIKRLNDFRGQNNLKLPNIGIRQGKNTIDIYAPAHNITELLFPRLDFLSYWMVTSFP